MVPQHSQIKLLSARSAFSQVPFTAPTHPPHLRVGLCLISTCSQLLPSFGVTKAQAPGVHISVHHFPCQHGLAKLAPVCKVGWEVERSSTGTQVTDHQWTDSPCSKQRGSSMDLLSTGGAHNSTCLPVIYIDYLAVQALPDQSHCRHLSCERNL